MKQKVLDFINQASIADMVEYILYYVFLPPGAIPYHDSIIESHPRPNITELLCKGNESKLTDCKHSMTPTCGASNTAAVYCKGENATGWFT